LTSSNTPEGAEGAEEVDSDVELTVSLGGKIIQDKLWYFVSGEGRERTVDPFYEGGAPEDDRGQYEREWQRYLGKLTFQANDANRLVGFLDYDGVDTTNRGIGDLTLQSASYIQDSPNVAYGASWESLINNNNFLTVKLTGYTGTNDSLPQSGADVAGRDDFDSGFEWQNYRYTWLEDKSRLSFDAAWNLFVDGLFTSNDSHNFKFGVVYEDSTQDERRTRNDGFTYVDDSYYCDSLDQYFDDPFCGVWSSDRGNEINLDAVQNGLHVYAQDSWKTGRVAVNYGVRYTQAQGGFSGGNESVYDVDMWAPRLGLVWDVSGNGKTAIKGHYGRYYEKLMVFMYDREASGNVFTPLEYWDYNFDTGEFDIPAGGREVADAAMDPDISHPYVDQYVLTVEHEVARDMLVGVDLVRRETRDIIAMVNSNLDYDALIAPDNPLTGDPIPFFDLLSPQENLLTNPDNAFRDYDSVIARYRKRYSRGWTAGASLVWTDMNATTDDIDGYEASFTDLNGQVNNEGKPGYFSEWELKLDGSVDLPANFVLSGFYTYRSGSFWTPYAQIRGLLDNNRTNLNLLERGSEQYDARSRLDLHLDWRLALGQKTSLTLILDVFNALNSDTVLEVSERWGTYYYEWDAHPEESEWVESSGYKAPLEVEQAREIRIGARFSF
jgi:hypothetical protein